MTETKPIKCVICGADAFGVWKGRRQKPIGCCHNCALDVLPRLIADAIDLPPKMADKAKQYAAQMNLAFQEALNERQFRRDRGDGR